MVYESGNAYKTLQHLQEQEIWKTINNIDGLSRLTENINLLEEITDGQLDVVFQKNPLLISVSPISRNEIDFLFVIEINSLPSHSVLASIQEHFQEQFPKKKRTYLGYNLTEIQGPDKTFTFMFHKNFMVGSFSAFLVEDAIRSLQNETAPFVGKFPEIGTVAKLQNDDGNLYINLESAQDLLNNFADFAPFSMGEFAFLDVQSSDKSIQLNGFTFVSDDPGMLRPHIDVTPGSFDLDIITPMQTSYVYHYSFAAGTTWGKNQQAYLQQSQPETWEIGEQLKTQFDLDVDYMYSFLDEELALLHFERLTGTDKAMILEVGNPGQATSYFDDISRQMANANGDTLYTETYRGFELKHMMAEEFPSLFFGKLGLGFQSTYYFTIDNFMVFSNTPNQLQKIIDAIREENTWAKSLRKNEFLSRVNQASNFSIFVNTPEFWSRMQKSITPYWKDTFSENSNLLRSLDNIAIQFSNVDGRFFTNIVVAQSETPVASILSPDPLKSTILHGKIISRPFLVRNNADNTLEILAQDSTNTLYQLNGELQLNWETVIGGPITSDIFQVDYYKNDKSQYVFTTESQLHMLDAKGQYLPEFPVDMKAVAPIRHFHVIDYDGSKNYRFSFSDDAGDIFLSDKNGTLLDGWNPNPVGKPLLQPMIHQRIGKRDVMIAMTSSGELHLKNRRGDPVSPFPIDFKAPIGGPYHLKKGNSVENSNISWVSEEGEWFEVNLNGKITKREQLFKPAANTKFAILNDQSGEHFLITSKDELGLSVLDPQGAALFNKEYLNVNTEQQFYRITAGKELIIVRDVESNRIHIFNLEGKLLTGGPLEGSQKIGLIYDSKKDIVDLFLVYGKELRKFRLSGF